MKHFVSTLLWLAISAICQIAAQVAQVQPELPTELAVDEQPVAAAKAVPPKNSLTNAYEKLLAQPNTPQEPVALPPPPPSPPSLPKIKASPVAKPAKAGRVPPVGPNGPQIAPAAFPVAPNSNKQPTLQDILKQQQQQGVQQQQLTQLQQGSVKGQVKPALAPIRGKPKPAPKMKESTLVWQNREKQLDAVQAIYENGGRITFKSEQFIRGYVPDSVIKRFQLGCTWCLQDPKGKGCICTKLQLVPKQKVTNLKANVVKPSKPQAGSPGGKEPTTPSGARDVGAKPPNNEDKDPKSTQPPPTTPIGQDADAHPDAPEVKVSEATRETFEKAFNQGFAAGQTAQNVPAPQSGQDKPKEGSIQKPATQDQQSALKPADKPDVKVAVVPPAKKDETPQASVQTPAAQSPPAAAVSQVQVPPTAPSKPSNAVDQLNALAAATQLGSPAVAAPTDASKTAAQAFAAAAVPPTTDATKPTNLAKPEPKIESSTSKLVIEGSPSAQAVLPAPVAPAIVPNQQQPAITSVFIPPEAKKEEVKAVVLPQVLPPVAPVTLVDQAKKEEQKAAVPPATPKAAVKPALVAEEPGDDDPLTGENQQANGVTAVVQPDKAAALPVAAVPVPPNPVPVPAPPLASATKPEETKVAVAPTNQAAAVQAVVPKPQTNVSPIALPPPAVVSKPDAQSPTLLVVAKEEQKPSPPVLPVQLPPLPQEKKEEIKPVAAFPQILPEVHNDPVPAVENIKPAIIPNGSPQPLAQVPALPAQGSPAPLNQASPTGPGVSQAVHPTLPQILQPAQALPAPAAPIAAIQPPSPQQSGSTSPQQPAAASVPALSKP